MGVGTKKTGQRGNKHTLTFQRKPWTASNDFHVRTSGEEMARVNPLPPAGRLRQWQT